MTYHTATPETRKAKDVVPEGQGFHGPSQPTGGTRPSSATNGSAPSPQPAKSDQ
jgi:hypothetical protein